jgi:hypothetical protein
MRLALSSSRLQSPLIAAFGFLALIVSCSVATAQTSEIDKIVQALRASLACGTRPPA